MSKPILTPEKLDAMLVGKSKPAALPLRKPTRTIKMIAGLSMQNILEDNTKVREAK